MKKFKYFFLTKRIQGKAQVGQKIIEIPKRKIIGKHIYGNLYECDQKVLVNKEELKEIVIKAAEIAKMHLVDVHAWSFQGEKGGVSVIALVTESHISIHAWSEYNYASVDVYTCGSKSKPLKAFKYIVEKLKPKKYSVHKVKRIGYKLE